MSIVQGVALAYLVVVVNDELRTFSFANWILVSTSFLMIVSAWDEYMTAVTVFVWIPRLLDSLIPFLLGVSEIIFIQSLRHESQLEWFFMAMAFTALVALIAFVNMYARAAAEADKNQILLKEMRSYQSLNLGLVSLSGIVLLVFAAVEAAVAASTVLDIALSTAALTLVLTFIARGAVYWNRVIRFARESASRAGEELREPRAGRS
jgi:hypothetical protein